MQTNPPHSLGNQWIAYPVCKLKGRDSSRVSLRRAGCLDFGQWLPAPWVPTFRKVLVPKVALEYVGLFILGHALNHEVTGTLAFKGDVDPSIFILSKDGDLFGNGAAVGVVLVDDSRHRDGKQRIAVGLEFIEPRIGGEGCWDH